MPTTLKRHDQIVLGWQQPEEDQEEVEIVAIDRSDPEAPLYTCYNAKDDYLMVLIILPDGKFSRVQFEREKEPWES